MKRNLLLATVIAFCLAVLLSVLPVSETVAKADVVLKKVSAFEYEVSYLVEEAGYTYDNDTTVTVNGVNLVKPSTEEGGTTEEAQTNAFFRTDGKKVEFLKKTAYAFTLTKGDTTQEFSVDTTTLPTEGSLRYSYDEEALEKYKTAVANATTVTDEDASEGRPIRVDDDYEVPCIASLVKDSYFDVENLTGTLYYCLPGSTTYSSKSVNDIDNVKFDVTKVGSYSFYMLLKNTFQSMSTADLVLGNGGWYAKDTDGSPVGEVVIPVFEFSVQASSNPKVTVSASEKAYQGLEYKVDSFNIVASDYNTEYTLYYSATEIGSDKITQYDKDFLENLGMVQVTAENEFESKNLFNSSSKTFTPTKKGYYYVVLHVVDFANQHATVISRPIDANGELMQVKYETQFFKYNWLSIMLLSIAALCLIATIVLICVKPKQQDTLSTKE